MPGSAALRFCIVSTFYPPYNFGGDGLYAHGMANDLARLGHQVTVVHSPSAYEMLAGGPPATSYDDHPNVTVRGLRTPLGPLGLLMVQQTGRPALQAAQLRATLEREPYDVIHYNNVSLLGGPHVFRYGSALKLCHLSDHWLVCPMHVAAGTPVVVRAHSALEEMVARHGGGLTYRNDEELLAAIRALRGDATLRARLGREGRAAYETELAEPVVLARYLGVVHELLASKRAAAC